MAHPDLERQLLKRVDRGYAWDCMQRLVDLGPHKIAGTEREHAAADWIEAEMQRLGLEEVRQEPFPVTVRDLAAGANVELPDQGVVFSGLPMAGSWPTPEEGIEAEVVFVGDGLAEEYGPERDARGKIVLYRHRWPDTGSEEGIPRAGPALEARARGAAAVLTYDELGPQDAVRVHIFRLGAHDYEVRIPIVSLAARDARQLRALLEQGPVRARVRSRIDQREGASRNVVGLLRGEREPDEYVLVASHYDTWYAGAADSLSGIGAVLGIARAFKRSGIRPERTLVFVAHGAQEQGMPQWLDWLIGASAFINLEHPDWVGRTFAMLNIDVVTSDPRSAYVECAPELLDCIRHVAVDVEGGRTPYSQVPAGLMSYVDAGAYLLAGVPSANVTFWPEDYWRYYHTQYDTIALVSQQALDWTMRLWGLAALRLSEVQGLHLRLDAALDHAARAAVAAAVETAESRGPSGPALEAGEALRVAATDAEVVQELMRHLSQRGGNLAERALREARRTKLWCLARLSRETRLIGGPSGTHVYEALTLYSREAAHLRRAAFQLERGINAADVLGRTCAILGSGRHLSPEAHATQLRLIADGGTWAPSMQRYVDVYPEWSALRAGASPATVLPRLRPKLAAAQAEAEAAAARAERVAEQCSERLRTTAERLAAALR